MSAGSQPVASTWYSADDGVFPCTRHFAGFVWWGELRGPVVRLSMSFPPHPDGRQQLCVCRTENNTICAACGPQNVTVPVDISALPARRPVMCSTSGLPADLRAVFRILRGVRKKEKKRHMPLPTIKETLFIRQQAQSFSQSVFLSNAKQYSLIYFLFILQILRWGGVSSSELQSLIWYCWEKKKTKPLNSVIPCQRFLLSTHNQQFSRSYICIKASHTCKNWIGAWMRLYLQAQQHTIENTHAGTQHSSNIVSDLNLKTLKPY